MAIHWSLEVRYLYASFLRKISILFSYRSLGGVYIDDVYIKDIRLRRYGGRRFDVENATVNPDNIGFCTPKGTPANKCIPAGLINSTLCQEPGMENTVDATNLLVLFLRTRWIFNTKHINPFICHRSFETDIKF